MISDNMQIKSALWCPYRLDFTFEARTSRGAMWHKDTYFIRIEDADGRVSYGEVPLFKGLSAEDNQEFESHLSDACHQASSALHCFSGFSSITFGFESAIAALTPSNRWHSGEMPIYINGLIWMGNKATMKKRIREKLDAGFRVLKLKIGGINFAEEVDLLKAIRKDFAPDCLELRLDANGSFTPDNALERLEILSEYNIHSLEQPIKAGQIEAMAKICNASPIPIALDEELIGCRSYDQKKELLDAIKPQYIILKPALCGGFKAADEYIDLIGPGRWWATSALESNVGLDAIASWLSNYDLTMPQGLGTGQLYSNNILSPICLDGMRIFYNPAYFWQSLEDLPWRE